MTVAAEHPQTRSEKRHRAAPRVRSYHPLGIASLGFITAVVGGWAGIAPFVGPDFNYPITSTTKWEWTASNALLHLWPGVVAVVAGLVYMLFADARSGFSRSVIRFSVLAAMAAGAWMVVGPALWPVFESTPAYVTQDTASMDFWMRFGSSLGPGLVIVVIGGLVFAAIAGREPMMGTAPATAERSETNAGDGTAAKADKTDMKADKPHPTEPATESQKTGVATSPTTPGPSHTPGHQLP